MRTAVIKPAAQRDLTELHDYIADRNPAAATRQVDRIQADIRRLVDMPHVGRRRADVPDLACCRSSPCT